MLSLMSSRRFRSERLGLILAAAVVLLGDVMAANPPPKAAPLVKAGEFHLKYARYGAAAGVLGDSIYVFGGSSAGAVTEVERIDGRTGRIESLPGTLIPRRYHAVLEHRGKFYLFGGEGYGLPGNPFEYAVEIYDPVTHTVSHGEAMPRPRSHMAAAKIGAKGYLIGGEKLWGRDFAQTNDTDIFDFTTGRWSVGPPMPTPRESAAAVVDSFILVPGGYRSPRSVRDVEMFVPNENVWKALPPLGWPVSAHSVAFLGEHLFLFGDYDHLDSIQAYNLRTRRSFRFKAGFRNGRHSAAVVCGGRIFVIGGTQMTEDGTESDLVQVFALNPAAQGE